ncbi:hypothetical protein [Herbidospora cretacea]|uniref:hypothetical protein n=1 Tax=Herbidospora cretacea TaxID=28444 RepID=UPI000773998F|nr:hypothetical protein [Herbidospora cretacea]
MNWLRDNDPACHVRADPATMAAVLDTIVRTPRPVRRRRRRSLVLIPLTALTAILVIMSQPGVSASYELGPAKSVAFSRNSDRIDIRIADPNADPERFRADFAAHGLDVTLDTVPTSPSLVGAVISVNSPQRMVHYHTDGFEIVGEQGSEWITSIRGTRCGDRSCVTAVSVPVDLRSPLELTIGRAPEPGERYEVGGDPTAPGEPLEGFDLTNYTVDEAARLLRELNVTVQSYHPERPPDHVGGWDYSAHTVQPEKVPGSWHVQRVFGGHAPDTVRLVVAAEPTDRPFWEFVDSLMFWRD